MVKSGRIAPHIWSSQKQAAKLRRIRCDHRNGRFVFLVSKYLPVFTILSDTHTRTHAHTTSPLRDAFLSLLIVTRDLANELVGRAGCHYNLLNNSVSTICTPTVPLEKHVDLQGKSSANCDTQSCDGNGMCIVQYHNDSKCCVRG